MAAAAESVVCTRMAKVQPRSRRQHNTWSHHHHEECIREGGRGVDTLMSVPGGRGLNEASLVLIFNKTDRKSRSNFSKCSSSLHHKKAYPKL